VTTRTSLIEGFAQNDNIHQHVFFGENGDSSINSYGYSPYPLDQYITWIKEIHETYPTSSKPFIISITGNSNDLELLFHKIQNFRKEVSLPNEYGFDVAVEVNLSCPNIPKVPPPAYNTESLLPYLIVTKRYYLEDPTLIIGLKLPPYTYESQFSALISATWRHRADQGVAFLTSTNTLGSGLVFNDQLKSGESEDMALPTGWGGLGGATIHPLSVGNVSKLVSLLESPTQSTKLKLAIDKNGDKDTENIVVFGVGGISNGKTLKHFLKVGAVAGEVATALGVEGVGVFERICKEAGFIIKEN
jgi:dihydroorotate dehydrogenase (fumarate)